MNEIRLVTRGFSYKLDPPLPVSFSRKAIAWTPPSAVGRWTDVVRSTQEADVACVLKGQDDGSWSVSLRSRGATDVALPAGA